MKNTVKNTVKQNAPMYRRSLLKAGGLLLALPWLETLAAATPPQRTGAAPRRFFAMTYALGLHGPFLNPTEAGRTYTPSRYLSHLKHLRDDFTVVSGSSHPGVSNGHPAEASILTGVKVNAGSSLNGISLDQYMASHLGHETRVPSLVLNVTGNSSPSYTANGSMIPAESDPNKLFKLLFIDTSPAEQKRQVAYLQQGRSIMDVVQAEAKSMQQRVSATDAHVLDNYFSGVRALEKRLAADQDWVKTAKPSVQEPDPVSGDRDVISMQRLFLDIVALALTTDSTRFITLHVNGSGNAKSVEGVTEGYHTLSHHGQKPEAIAQLGLVQDAQMKDLARFLDGLKASREGNATLLDNTMVLLTSNLGNASSHDCRNMPVILAGGGFQHGQHLAFDQKKNYPLPNLYLSMLHRMGINDERFASSTGTMDGLLLRS
jgi:hypothetical protein